MRNALLRADGGGATGPSPFFVAVRSLDHSGAQIGSSQCAPRGASAGIFRAKSSPSFSRPTPVTSAAARNGSRGVSLRPSGRAHVARDAELDLTGAAGASSPCRRRVAIRDGRTCRGAQRRTPVVWGYYPRSEPRPTRATHGTAPGGADLGSAAIPPPAAPPSRNHLGPGASLGHRSVIHSAHHYGRGAKCPLRASVVRPIPGPSPYGVRARCRTRRQDRALRKTSPTFRSDTSRIGRASRP